MCLKVDITNTWTHLYPLFCHYKKNADSPTFSLKLIIQQQELNTFIKKFPVESRQRYQDLY